MLVVIKRVCGHVKPLVLLQPFDYFFKAKTDHHIIVVHFFKKRCLVAFSVPNLIVFN